jgi:hypothetical protein
MTSDEEFRENMLRAIELMTAWAGGGSSTDFMIERIAKIGDEEGQMGYAQTFTGLTSLAGYLLMRLTQLTGKSAEELLQLIALEHQTT